MRLPYKASTFNLAVSGLAAASVAFWLFAMPPSLLTGLLASIGAGDMLGSGAVPGPGARLAAVAAGAGTTFLFVWLLLRAFDGSPAARELHLENDEWDWVVPRLRRADSHPDAPARRPISAAREFGEPVQTRIVPAPEQAITGTKKEEEAPPLPAFLSDEVPVPAAEFDTFSGIGADSQIADADLDPFETLELSPYRIEDAEPAQQVVDAEAEAAEQEFAAGQSDPLLGDETDTPDDWPASKEEAERPPVAEARCDPPVASNEDFAPDEGMPPRESLIARLALPEAKGESVSSLLRRLDAGLTSREWPIDKDGPSRRPEGMEDRLRAAIDDLHKMVSRRG